VGRNGQVGGAIRRGGAGRELGDLRDWPRHRHRGRSAGDRVRGTRRRYAVQRGGGCLRASPDLVRRGGGRPGGGRETPMTAQGSEPQELADWLTIKVASYLDVPPH